MEPRAIKPFQQRVIDEKKELDGKLDRLNAFIQGEQFTKLDPNERSRLNMQCAVMQTYSSILQERIAAFT